MSGASPIVFVAALGFAGPVCGYAESRNASAPEETSVGTRSTPGVSWEPAIEVASGDAHAGRWRMNDSDFRYVDDATVAMLADGTVGVAWAENDRLDLFFQRYGTDRKRLGTPSNVSRTPEVFSWLPRIVMDGDDEVFVLWQEIVFSGGSHGGEIFFSRSMDGGRSFEAPMNLSNTTAGDGKGRLTADTWDNGSLDLIRAPGGDLLAAWTEYQGALWVSRSRDEGRTFTAPLRVAGTDRRPARGPALAADGNAVYLAWTVGEEKTADIHFAVSLDGAQTFGPPRLVSRTRGHSDAPKIAVDRHGVVHLVHAESRRGDSHVLYARLRRAGGIFERARTISDPKGTASFPSLAVDASGHVYVVWEHHRDAEEKARGIGFTWSRDGGATFAAPAIIPGTLERRLGDNGSRQGKLMRKLAVSDRSDLAVVNSYFRDGKGSHVRLIIGRATQH